MNELPLQISSLLDDGKSAFDAGDFIAAEKCFKEAQVLSDSLTSDEIKRARTLLNDGVAAFAAGNIDAAIACFKKSKELAASPRDPRDVTRQTARLYLAAAYCSKHIPGLRSQEAAENLKYLDWAEREFREVLADLYADRRERNYAAEGLKSVELSRQTFNSIR